MKFKEFLDAIVFEEPFFPVVQNFEAASYDQLDKIKDGLFYQLFNPVKWTQTIEFIAAKNVNTFLEIGPGKVLTSLGKRINKEKNYISIDSIESLERFKEI